MLFVFGLSVSVRFAFLEIETARRIAAGVESHLLAVEFLVKDVSLVRLEYPPARHVLIARQPCAVLAAGTVLLLSLDHVGCVMAHHGGACDYAVTSHVSTSIGAPHHLQYLYLSISLTSGVVRSYMGLQPHSEHSYSPVL